MRKNLSGRKGLGAHIQRHESLTHSCVFAVSPAPTVLRWKPGGEWRRWKWGVTKSRATQTEAVLGLWVDCLVEEWYFTDLRRVRFEKRTMVKLLWEMIQPQIKAIAEKIGRRCEFWEPFRKLSWYNLWFECIWKLRRKSLELLWAYAWVTKWMMVSLTEKKYRRNHNKLEGNIMSLVFWGCV